MAWTTPRTWTDGELVTAAIMNAHVRDNLNMVPNHLYKTADQSVVSSTTLIDDTHLQFSIGANEGWVFRFVLASTGPGGIKFALNAPASSAGWWSFLRTATGSVDNIAKTAATFVDGETSSGVDSPDIQYIDGYVLTAGTSGTFKLRWAQLSSSGTATIIKKGSFLERRKV